MKILPSLIFILLLSSSLTGQISLGLDGGPTFTALRGTDRVEDLGPALGWQAGLSAAYRFKPVDIGLRSGLYRDFRATQTELPLTDVNGEPNGLVKAYSNWNYLTVPLELCVYQSGKVATVYAFGFYAAFLQRQWFSLDKPVFAGDTIENTANSTPVDLGITARIDWHFPLSDHIDLSAGLRTFYGLNNASSVPLEEEGKIKHFGLSLMAGMHYEF